MTWILDFPGSLSISMVALVERENDMRIVAVIICLVVCSSFLSAQGKTLKVPSQYQTIWQAIWNAKDTDTILVAPGIYKEYDLAFMGKAITIRSSGGAAVTTIDAEKKGSVFQFRNGEGSKSIVNGFTMINGSGVVSGSSTYGGAVYCLKASPTLTRNVFRMNEAAYGGAIYCKTSNPTINENVFDSNTGRGGGIACYSSSNPRISGNLFTKNQGPEGGAIYCESQSSPPIIGNTISENIAKSIGGGIFIVDSIIECTVESNLICKNTAENAGVYTSTSLSSVIPDNCAVQHVHIVIHVYPTTVPGGHIPENIIICNADFTSGPNPTSVILSCIFTD